MLVNHSAFANQEVFILRIWTALEGETRVRGQIQHVRSGETYPLKDLENIAPTIEKLIHAPDEKPTHSSIK